MIKLINHDATFEIPSEYDEALVCPAADKEAESKAAQARFQEYLETLDISKLRVREGAKLSFFVIRTIPNAKMAEIRKDHYVFSPEDKKSRLKDPDQYFSAVFEEVCMGLKKDDGTILKVKADDVRNEEQASIVNSALILMTLGKHLKNA